MRRLLLWGIVGWCAHTAWAATPAELLAEYQKAAGVVPSAERGAHFYHHRFAHSEKMPSCASCHGDRPHEPGQHVVTGKRIAPFSPLANPERFTDPAKVEKWFRRNCTEVVGRECTPAEKGDLLAFLLQGRVR